MARKTSVISDNTEKFPVWVYLSDNAPFVGGRVKVNNILVSKSKIVIHTMSDLLKLKPIEKYLIIQKANIEDAVVISIEENNKVEELETKVEVEVEDTSVIEETPTTEENPIKEESSKEEDVVESEITNEE